MAKAIVFGRVSPSIHQPRVHMSGDPDAALTLEEEAAECSSRVSERGLGSACERGDAEEVKFLLHAGVDPDTRFEVSTRRC